MWIICCFKNCFCFSSISTLSETYVVKVTCNLLNRCINIKLASIYTQDSFLDSNITTSISTTANRMTLAMFNYKFMTMGSKSFNFCCGCLCPCWAIWWCIFTVWKNVLKQRSKMICSGYRKIVLHQKVWYHDLCSYHLFWNVTPSATGEKDRVLWFFHDSRAVLWVG